MNFFIRHRLIIWILAGLLIISLSILGSFIYFSWNEQAVGEEMPECASSCQMMTSELNLNPSQNSELETILDRYRDTSEALVNLLRDYRMTLMDELKKEHPDTLRIRLLTMDIGNTQALLTSLAAHQYLQIRNICDSSQQARLSDFYCDMFGCPRVNGEKGNECRKSNQRQHRHGQE